MEDVKEKKALSLAEVVEVTGLTADTLRYYEQEGLLLPIARKQNGHRSYTQRDLEWIQFVKCLRSTGMPVSEIARYKTLMDQGDATVTARRELLLSYKNRLLREMEELNRNLSTLEYKIQYYQDIEASLMEN